VPGLRLGQQRSHALLSALVTFRLQPHGFTNKDLRAITAELRALPAGAPSTGQMTYDLRRLRLHGLIERVPHTHRYRVTDAGLHTAMFLTRVHDRLLPTGLAHLGNPSNDGTLCSASTAYQRAIDALAPTTAWPHESDPATPNLTQNSGSAGSSPLAPRSRLARTRSRSDRPRRV